MNRRNLTSLIVCNGFRLRERLSDYCDNVVQLAHADRPKPADISKVRRGKECQPQYLAEDDRTSVTVPEMTVDDLSAASIDWGIAQHQKHFRTSVAWAEPAEFLAQAQLLRPYLAEEEYLPQFQPSLAALLLFGKASVIQRNIPFFETVVITDGERIPIRKNVIDSVRELCTSENSILRSRLPDVPADVLKELVVNAYIHRLLPHTGSHSD